MLHSARKLHRCALVILTCTILPHTHTHTHTHLIVHFACRRTRCHLAVCTTRRYDASPRVCCGLCAWHTHKCEAWVADTTTGKCWLYGIPKTEKSDGQTYSGIDTRPDPAKVVLLPFYLTRQRAFFFYLAFFMHMALEHNLQPSFSSGLITGSQQSDGSRE